MTALKDRITAQIKREGPLSVAEYMAVCLFDPTDGFYPTRDPLGSEGDFITAPEVSQIFGELLGLWCVQSWRDMGSPKDIHLIELGPGRGVMMSDMLRAGKLDPNFIQAAKVTLVEASPALEAVQGQTLAGSPCPITWASSLDASPEGPCLIIGNEFLDCLPIRQFIRKGDVWHERIVHIGKDGKLEFAISPAADKSVDLSHFVNVPDGALVELCSGLAQMADSLQKRFTRNDGRALFIDYGPAKPEIGDTLQAISKHKKVDPLTSPGNADLTARVDFGYLKSKAESEELSVFGPTTQAELLLNLGLAQRQAALSQRFPDKAEKLAAQTERLVSADQMGELFKAICIQSGGLPLPAGFSR